MTELTDEEKEDIACAIRHYLLSKYFPITDIYTVIDNRVLLDDDPVIYAYYCPCQTIYLDENYYAVRCGRQYIEYYDSEGKSVEEGEEYDPEKSMVTYDFRDEIPYTPIGFDGDTSIGAAMTRLGSYEWKRSKPGGGGII